METAAQFFCWICHFRSERIGSACITLATIPWDEPPDDAQALYDPLPLARSGGGWIRDRLPSGAGRAVTARPDHAADFGKSLRPDRRSAFGLGVDLDPLGGIPIQLNSYKSRSVRVRTVAPKLHLKRTRAVAP